jgi:dephospho-CoA kinase
MTFILGITGGIASGKTTATNTLEALGVEVVDADVIARNIVAQGSPALTNIVKHFGASILLGPGLLGSGELNRTRLRDIIFSNPKERLWLENLLHPLVRENILQQLSTIRSPYGVLVSPLLFEKEQQELINHSLVIDAPTSIQKVRAVQRDNVDQQQIEDIIHSQLAREERNKYADDIIVNTGNIEDLQQAVTAYHHQLLSKVRQP